MTSVSSPEARLIGSAMVISTLMQPDGSLRDCGVVGFYAHLGARRMRRLYVACDWCSLLIFHETLMRLCENSANAMHLLQSNINSNVSDHACALARAIPQKACF